MLCRMLGSIWSLPTSSTLICLRTLPNVSLRAKLLWLRTLFPVDTVAATFLRWPQGTGSQYGQVKCSHLQPRSADTWAGFL